MRWLIAWSLRFRLLVLALAAAIVALGVTQLRDMPVDALPEYAPPTVEIQTEALGLSAAEVEQLVTVPMEQDLLNGVAFLDDIRSQSVAGLSRILLVFEPGTDIFRARQVVAERLTQAHALPNVSKPPQMLQPLSSTNRVMMIGVSSSSVSAIQLSVLARWTVVPRLLGVPGVANVSIWGNRDRQLQVQVDPERLRDLGVSLEQVIETTGNSLWVSPLSFVEASTPGTGGFIDTPNQRLGIQHVSTIRTATDLARVRLDDTGGRNLRLGDVASVVEDHQPLIGDAVVHGGDGLLLVVEKFPNASALEVTRGVDAAIAAMRPGLSGVEFDSGVYRPARFLDRAIDNVAKALLIGALLLILALGALFFRWRTVLVGLVTIPLSIVAAALVLHALGETLNSMLLAGLAAAVVLVVDDVIVDADSVARRVRQRRAETDDKSAAAVVLEATIESRSAALYGTLIVALAVVPLFFLEGVADAFFPSIAAAFLLALAASMLVALTIAPALTLLFLSKEGREPAESPLLQRLAHAHERVLSRVLGKPVALLLAVGALVVVLGAAAPFFRQSLLPTFHETELLIRWDGPPGTSLPEMNRITGRATRELRRVEGVRGVGAHVGRAVTADQVVGVNSGEIWVSIDPAADYDATLARVKAVVAGYPGLSSSVGTYSNEKVREVLSGADEDVVVRLYGEDLDVLATKAKEVEQRLAAVDGLVDPKIQLPAAEPTLEVKVDLAAARRYGIKPGDVRRAAATLLSGITVGSLFEAQKVFDVVVWGDPDTRSSLTSVRRLLIDTPDGGHVRLGQVAAVRIAPNPTVIDRQGVSRFVDVGASVRGRDLGAALNDVEATLQKVDFPLGFNAVVIAAEGQPWLRVLSIAVAAAIGILLLLQAMFGSWRLAALLFATLPLTVAGGLMAALLDGRTLSLGSYIGLFVALGLGARNGIFLIRSYRQLEHNSAGALGPELVVRATREQFGRVAASAVAGTVVLLPVVVAGATAGYEVIHPLAAVVLGGLVTSTLVSLFVVPAVYLRYGAGHERVVAVAATGLAQVGS
jgi:CzcA family heavy metal efflux pump